VKKQILTIAEFDGWKQDKCDTLTKGRGLYKAWYHYEQIKKLYATNLNELHRVALGVMNNLVLAYMADSENEDDSRDIPLKYIQSIEYAMCHYRPIRKCYTHLVEAVAEGIEYINSTKNK
jgi:hypothetical protein